MAFDHRIIAHGHAKAVPGLRAHHDAFPDLRTGEDADIILDQRAGADRHALPDRGELADPDPRVDDGTGADPNLTAVEQRAERTADYSGRSYLSGRVDHGRIASHRLLTPLSKVG